MLPFSAVTAPLVVIAPSVPVLVSFTFWFAVTSAVVVMAFFAVAITLPFVEVTREVTVPSSATAPLMATLPASALNSILFLAVASSPTTTLPPLEVRVIAPCSADSSALVVTSPSAARLMLPSAVRLLLLVRVPLTRRFSTEISPDTFRLTATVIASELSLIHTSPSMAGVSPDSVSRPSTMMLLN